MSKMEKYLDRKRCEQWREILGRICCACEGKHRRNCKVGKSILERERALNNLEQIAKHLESLAFQHDVLSSTMLWRGAWPYLVGLFHDPLMTYPNEMRVCAAGIRKERECIAASVTMREDVRRLPITHLFDELCAYNKTIPAAELHRAIADFLNEEIGFLAKKPYTEVGIRKRIERGHATHRAIEEAGNRAVAEVLNNPAG
jgi:hypothetical protein